MSQLISSLLSVHREKTLIFQCQSMVNVSTGITKSHLPVSMDPYWWAFRIKARGMLTSAHMENRNCLRFKMWKVWVHDGMGLHRWSICGSAWNDSMHTPTYSKGFEWTDDKGEANFLPQSKTTYDPVPPMRHHFQGYDQWWKNIPYKVCFNNHPETIEKGIAWCQCSVK